MSSPDGRGVGRGIGSLGGAYPDRTVGSFCPSAPPLLDSIRPAFPADAPLSLDNDAVYALTAYLLGWAKGPGSISFESADGRFPLPLPPHTNSPSWASLGRLRPPTGSDSGGSSWDI